MPASEIIDQGIFSKLLDSMGGDIDFMNELVDTYLASTPDIFTTIKQALAAGDASGLQRSAHSLKTGSASFGALAFAAQCKELEELGKTAVLESAEEKITAMEAAYPEVATALRASLQAARAASN